MFAAKSFLFVAFLALFNVVLATVPPACLLASVGNYDDPSDMKKLCGSESKKIQNAIADNCADKTVKTALKAYEAACKEAGQEVELAPISDSETSTGTESATKTATGTETETETESESATGTSSSTATGTEPSSTDEPSEDDSESGQDGGESPSGTESAPPVETDNLGHANKADSFLIAAVVAMVGAAAAF